MQGIDLAYVDWKPNNMCWNAEHKLFVLIDFGLVCALNVPPEQRAVGCSPGECDAQGGRDSSRLGPRIKHRHFCLVLVRPACVLLTRLVKTGTLCGF